MRSPVRLPARSSSISYLGVVPSATGSLCRCPRGLPGNANAPPAGRVAGSPPAWLLLRRVLRRREGLCCAQRRAALARQLDPQAQALGQQARARSILGAERTLGTREPDVMQQPAERQAVLAHQPDPLAAGPGQLGGLVAGGFEPAVQSLGEQPRRASQVTDMVLDQPERGRRTGRGQLGGRRAARRRTGLLGDLDDDAVRVPRVQERLLPVRVVQVDANRFDAERPDPGQRVLDVADEKVEVVRAGPAGGQGTARGTRRPGRRRGSAARSSARRRTPAAPTSSPGSPCRRPRFRPGRRRTTPSRRSGPACRWPGDQGQLSWDEITVRGRGGVHAAPGGTAWRAHWYSVPWWIAR